MAAMRIFEVISDKFHVLGIYTIVLNYADK